MPFVETGRDEDVIVADRELEIDRVAEGVMEGVESCVPVWLSDRLVLIDGVCVGEAELHTP